MLAGRGDIAPGGAESLGSLVLAVAPRDLLADLDHAKASFRGVVREAYGEVLAEPQDLGLEVLEGQRQVEGVPLRLRTLLASEQQGIGVGPDCLGDDFVVGLGDAAKLLWAERGLALVPCGVGLVLG